MLKLGFLGGPCVIVCEVDVVEDVRHDDLNFAAKLQTDQNGPVFEGPFSVPGPRKAVEDTEILWGRL